MRVAKSVIVVLDLSIMCHHTNVHISFDGGSVKVDLGSLADLLSARSVHTVILGPRQEANHNFL